jgi:hypothetical protein
MSRHFGLPQSTLRALPVSSTRAAADVIRHPDDTSAAPITELACRKSDLPGACPTSIASHWPTSDCSSPIALSRVQENERAPIQLAGISSRPANSRRGSQPAAPLTNADVAERVCKWFVLFFLGAVGGMVLLLICIVGMILDSLIYS